MKDLILTTKDQAIIADTLNAIGERCSSMSYGGSIGENTARIMAALDVIAGIIATAPPSQR